MGPKEAVCHLVDSGAKGAVVTNPETLEAALLGNGGTRATGACWGLGS